MRSLFLHTKNFKSNNFNKKDLIKFDRSLTILVTLEPKDTINSIRVLISEIKKSCKDFGEKSVVLFPFSHLSNNLMEKQKAKKLFFKLNNLMKKTKLNSLALEFGTDKEFLLDVYGHPGNVRLRVIE